MPTAFPSRVQPRSTARRPDAPLVLIVEDQFLIAMDMMQMVEALGYRTCGPATSGLEAVELAARLKPDLLLLDVNLDGPFDGPMAARAITAARDIPVVYATAYGSSDMQHRIAGMHPAPILTKPIEPAQLERALRAALAARLDAAAAPGG